MLRRRNANGLAALLATAFLGSALAPISARADKPKLHLQRVDADGYPVLKTYLTLVESDGRVITGKTKDDFKLLIDSNEVGPAADAKAVDQTGEPVFVVIVAQISQAMHDVFEDEKRGIKQIAQAAADMKGSKVALLTYAQDVKRVAELSKPDAIDGAAGGIAEDDQGAESHLLDAIRTAMDLLNAKGVPDKARKLIVVFSDGIDVSGSERKAFAELGKRANLAGGTTGSPIVIDTIGYAPFEKEKLRNLFELSKQTNGVDRTCKSPQEVGAQFSNVADEVRKQYLAIFQSPIAGDSKDHGIQVTHETGSGPAFSETVNATLIPSVPVVVEVPIWKKWWFWVFCVALPLMLIIVVVMKLLGNREPAPEPIAAPEPEKPAAAQPQRTMALDLNMSDKGPTVGWIVGLSGRYNEKTFKLRPAVTSIGRADDVDVKIEDPKVSRKHCEIRFDGNTYKIVDLGSSTGVFLNDKRTPTSELVDGDSFRLGDTQFKFKSIN